MMFIYDMFDLVPEKLTHFIPFYHNLQIMPIQLSLNALSPNASISDSRKWKRLLLNK